MPGPSGEKFDEYITSLDEGHAHLFLPKNMGADSTQDFCDWCELLIRVLKRRSQAKATKSAEFRPLPEGTA